MGALSIFTGTGDAIVQASSETEVMAYSVLTFMNFFVAACLVAEGLASSQFLVKRQSRSSAK